MNIITKPTQPSFSIIIACYNAERTITAALDSILPQLNTNDSVIIIDDLSTDNSVSLIKKYSDSRIRLVLHNKNRGICKTRNTGIKYISNDYVAFMDCDDLWPKNRQALLMQELRQPSPPKVVSGQVEHFICPSMPAEQANKFILPPTQNATLPGTVIFHHSLVNKVKGFNESLYCGEFLDFISRMEINEDEWKKIKAPMLQRRIHGMNYSLQKKHHQTDYLKAIREHIKRKKCLA